MKQFEIHAGSRHEFNRIIEFLRSRRMEINDTYEPEYKILVHLSKREKLDLEERGVDLR